MTYDPVDTNDDGVVDADVNNESVKTEQAVIGVDPSDGGAGIQAAIDALPAEGGVVNLRRGTYTLDSTVNINKDNVTIQGDGWNTYLILADSADAVMIDFTGQSYLTFRDFEIDGNRENQSNDTAATHVQMINSDDDSHYVSVENIYFRDACNSNLNFDNDGANRHSHIIVTDCYFDNNHAPAESGIQPGEDNLEFKTSDFVTVANCWFSQAQKHSLEFERTKYVSVTGCLFEDTGYNGDALLVASPDSGSDRSEFISISNNVLYDSQNTAIGVSGGKDIGVSNNVVQKAGNGLRVGDGANSTTAENVSLSNNIIREPTGQGFNISHSVNGLQIANNQVYGGNKGLDADNLDGAVIKNNLFGGHTNSAMEFKNGGTNLRVHGNDIFYVGKYGVYLDGYTESEVSNNRVLSASDYGIFATNATRAGEEVLIKDNVLRDGGNFAVRLNGQTDSEVIGNKFDETDPMQLTSNSSDIEVRWNVGLSSVSNNASNVVFLSNEGHDDAVSSIPYSSPSAGDVYLDDGTNTSDGNPHRRYYDGTSWTDL